MIPGTILTHWGVTSVIPPISDLPDNVVKGFDEVFKFKYLEQDAAKIVASAGNQVEQCSTTMNPITPAGVCPGRAYESALARLQQSGRKMNAIVAKAEINAMFQTSLDVVNKIANDKYFGNDDLKSTGKELTEIKSQLAQIDDEPPCYIGVPAFCEIYTSGDSIVGGMAEVNAGINKFKDSDIIKRWDDNKSLLTFLHALPYIMVLAMLFFTIFWLRGGICCCCQGGTKAGTFALIPMILLWLVSFVIYLVVLAVGAAMKYASDKIDVPVLKGNPTLKDAIDHIQTNYPEFWKIVFAELSDGLDSLYKASWFFTVAAIVIALYSCCECCCRPYPVKDAEDAAKEGS
jgi:hypothetical protein